MRLRDFKIPSNIILPKCMKKKKNIRPELRSRNHMWHAIAEISYGSMISCLLPDCICAAQLTDLEGRVIVSHSDNLVTRELVMSDL